MTKKYIIIQTIYSNPNAVGPFLENSGFSNDPISDADYAPNGSGGVGNVFSQYDLAKISDLPKLASESALKLNGYQIYTLARNLDGIRDSIKNEYSAIRSPFGANQPLFDLMYPGATEGMLGINLLADSSSPDNVETALNFLDGFASGLEMSPQFFALGAGLGAIVDGWREVQSQNPLATREIFIATGIAAGADVYTYRNTFEGIPFIGDLASFIARRVLNVGTAGIILKELYNQVPSYIADPNINQSQRLITQTSPDSYKTSQGDPLILDLSGNGIIDLVGLAESRVLFDMNADGKLNRTAWVDNGDGILVMDKNNNGIIDNATEMFENPGETGSQALLNLRKLDTNYDGKFNSADDQFGDVKVWIDANSDGITDAGELKTLAELGITEIDLDAATVSIEDEHGNINNLIKFIDLPAKSANDNYPINELRRVA